VKPCNQVVLIQFDEDLALIDQVTLLDLDFLDDTVRLRLDFDLGYGFNPPDRNDRPCDSRALYGGSRDGSMSVAGRDRTVTP
jgi:hypothetical protein